VLQVLVQKTEVIQQELGSLSPVIERKVSSLLAQGIRHDETETLQQSLETLDLSRDEDEPGIAVVRAELEGGRLRQQKLVEELNELQGLLKKSSDWLGLSDLHFREALSSSLNVLNVKGLEPLNEEEAGKDPARARWRVPALDQDPSWATTLDTLREPRKQGQKIWEWRRESPIRPVVFRDSGSLDGEVVHLHLENRLVQRLLGRVLSQGFLHDELTRACVLLTDDPIPRVLVLGRLSLYGERAARLHDEVIAMAAEWLHPNQRQRLTLKPLPEREKDDVLQLLEQSLATPRLQHVAETTKTLLQSNAPQDIADLIPHLDKRAQVLEQRAKRKLLERGSKEAKEMCAILEDQRKRILDQQTKKLQLNIFDEQRQLESDRKYWRKRLDELANELETEPARIEAGYQVKARRVEPVGLVYLWPVSG
jgi:hypothetical protein